ncbi:MAG: ABC transporter ATP-binding protein [Spirochaetales bacterium]|nr:ABC transporter ATP-binding protein [Spirochaetales bacterium]
MGHVELRNVWKIYDKSFEAVKGISVSFSDGEFVSLLGPSGCGKTSTLRMVAGLEEISRGEIFIDSIKVNDLEPGDRNVAMAFEAYALYPHLTVYENIAYPLRIRKIADSEIKTRVNEMCESLGITKYVNEFPSSLSGGVQQSTGLARALVRPASLYLLDEVLSHLDAAERTMLRAEIRRVQKLMNLTALFVTHDQLEAMAMSDRIIVMNDGIIHQIGTPEEIYDSPEDLFVAGFVGEPPMNTLRVKRITEDGKEYLQIGSSKLTSAELGLKAFPQKSEFIIAMRPKYVGLLDSSKQKGVEGSVHTFENLGDYTQAAIELESGDIVFMIGDVDLRLQLDEKVILGFVPEKVLFYDIETTKQIKDI